MYCTKEWTQGERDLYWDKSQVERLIGSDVEISRATGSWQPNPTATSITVKVFPIPSDNDTVSWQESTDGNLNLCYRDGRVYLDWLEYWQPYAVKTEQSTFASTTQTWQPGILNPNAFLYCALARHTCGIAGASAASKQRGGCSRAGSRLEWYASWPGFTGVNLIGSNDC